MTTENFNFIQSSPCTPPTGKILKVLYGIKSEEEEISKTKLISFIKIFGTSPEQIYTLSRIFELPENIQRNMIRKFRDQGISQTEINTLQELKYLEAKKNTPKINNYYFSKLIQTDFLSKVDFPTKLGEKALELFLSLKTLVARENVIYGGAPYFDNLVVESLNKIIAISILDKFSSIRKAYKGKKISDRELKAKIFKKYFLPQLPDLNSDDSLNPIAVRKRKITSANSNKTSLRSFLTIEKFKEEARKPTTRISLELSRQVVREKNSDEIPNWLLKDEDGEISVPLSLEKKALKTKFEKEFIVLAKIEAELEKIKGEKDYNFSKTDELINLLGIDLNNYQDFADMGVAIRTIKLFLLTEKESEQLEELRAVLRENLPKIIKSSTKSADIVRAFQSIACREFLMGLKGASR